MGGRALHKQTFVHNKGNKNAPTTTERTMAKWQQEEHRTTPPATTKERIGKQTSWANLNKPINKGLALDFGNIGPDNARYSKQLQLKDNKG